MDTPHFARVSSRELSLWQSAVAETIRKQLSAQKKPFSTNDVLRHPMSIATTEHVTKQFDNSSFKPLVPAKDDGQHDALVYKSHLAFQMANAIADDNKELTEKLVRKYRQFSDKDINPTYPLGTPPDYGFASCAITYAKYKITSGNYMTYNDWMVQGNNDINYSVIDWKLPNNAKVGILGDWGTGLPDAIALLRNMMIEYKPDAIIHLGDIYYSGTPDECHHSFADVFTTVFDEVLGKGNRIPVFSIPGNHDYYAWGAEYYNVVSNLNNYKGLTSAIQPASYFCLRTEDNGWQFLGMDTGYYDSSPKNQLDPTYAGPWLHDSEVYWLRDKVSSFDGATILLSHHQLFSSNTALNGKTSVMRTIPYFNPYLYRAFSDFLPTKIAAWIWGHEHNFVMYENGLNGLAKGRLVGNSAYEELTSADPYKVNYPQVPYLVSEPGYDKYKLGINADPNGIEYYNHGYAIIDLANRSTPTSKVVATYVQFPAWGENPPANIKSSEITTEDFELPKPPKGMGDIVKADNWYTVDNQDGLPIQPPYSGLRYYYPILNPKNKLGPTNLGRHFIITPNDSSYEELLDGSVVAFKRLSSSSSAECVTVGFGNNWLYYTDFKFSNGSQYSNNKERLWKIHKVDRGDGLLRIGDYFYLESVAYPGKYAIPNYVKKWSELYITVGSRKDFAWKFELPPSA